MAAAALLQSRSNRDVIANADAVASDQPALRQDARDA